MAKWVKNPTVAAGSHYRGTGLIPGLATATRPLKEKKKKEKKKYPSYKKHQNQMEKKNGLENLNDKWKNHFLCVLHNHPLKIWCLLLIQVFNFIKSKRLRKGGSR